MDQFARFVLGYHGCQPDFAEVLFRGELPIAQWLPSQNPYDWLGHGIYFWEYAPQRAREWGGGGVVGAVIQLGRCLDFTDVRFTDLLASAYQASKKSYRQHKRKLPKNRDGRRELDCLVINTLVAAQDQSSRFQTVRGPFLEGRRVFAGSGIFRESHIQIAVRDPTCILGVFRPNPS